MHVMRTGCGCVRRILGWGGGSGDISDSSLASHHVAWLAISFRSGDGQLM